MYLKRLEIHGFKSFALKTVLEFEPGLTAVVGPNGSGKSNVADALRWVMGEQSMKLLRGKKSEDVIFAGSDKKSKLSMADVTLTFDNKDRKLPYEYSEVALTRRYFRNGESEYLINNQKVRLLDVVDALMRSGFGASNYAVIGQGTIDQMVLAGPSEIKGLVEEAAGVKPYYIKREKTWRKLDQTEENLQRVSELTAEIEPRLRSLRRQAKRMEEREVVANELADLQLQFFGNQYYLLETDLGALKTQLELKDKAIQSLEAQTKEFQGSLEKEERATSTNLNFSEELEKKISFLEAKRYKVQEELAEIRGKLRAQIVPGKTDGESLNIEKLDYERQLDAMNQKLKALDAQLYEEGKQFTDLKTTVDNFNKKIEEARNSKLDTDELRRMLEHFENEFTTTLEGLTFENFSEIKTKLRQLVGKLGETRRNLMLSAPADLSGLLISKEDTQLRLHKLELSIVEHSTLKQSYLDNIDSYNAKLNQIKSLMNDDPEKFKSELFSQEGQVNASLTELVGQINDLRENLNKVMQQEKDKKSFLIEEEKKFRQISSDTAKLKDEYNQVLVEKVRLETRLEAVNKEAEAALGEKIAELINHKKLELPAELPSKIEKLKRQLELSGGIDESTLQEYRETEERYNYLSHQSEDLSKAVIDLKTVIEELDQVIKTQFNEAYNKISEKFAEYFRILFNGGRAQMTLQKSISENDDEFSDEESVSDEAATQSDESAGPSLDGVRRKKPQMEISGIEIKATPPGKKLASIAALSGGERALTAIALLCSMLAAYPSPFVVLDEVDAALDEANSIRFGKILGTLAHQTQFITITHNRETMRQAHTLYGVTMTDEGISKILSLKLEQAEKVIPVQ
jgi:chromosome segregation protein